MPGPDERERLEQEAVERADPKLAAKLAEPVSRLGGMKMRNGGREFVERWQQDSYHREPVWSPDMILLANRIQNILQAGDSLDETLRGLEAEAFLPQLWRATIFMARKIWATVIK